MRNKNSFPHLHVHSEYSPLDGMRPLPTMVELAAKRRDVEIMALTDHGTIAGLPLFHKACKMHGIKPILGVECYFTPNAETKIKDQKWFGHITLLAKNRTGYDNLVKLITAANRPEHFYYKPRVDWHMLKKYREGIVCLTGCAGGILPKAIEVGVADEVIQKLIVIFGDDLYGEVQYLDITPQGLNDEIRAVCDTYNIKTVCTNDAHYPMPDDADIHQLLIAMSTRALVWSKSRFRIDSTELYLKTWDEMLRDGMRESSAAVIEIEMGNTVELAESIEEYDIGGEVIYPIPPRWRDVSDLPALLKSLAIDGLHKKGIYKPEYMQRIDAEMEVIEAKKYVRYFLMLADLYEWIHRNNIVAGPGRGSAAASLVLYAIGATGIDPMKRPAMKFERFLNIHRLHDEPDVDCDIASHHRHLVIEYLEKTYGPNNTAKLGTITTYAAKALLNDMVVALGARSKRINIDVLPQVWNAYIHDVSQARMFGEEKPEPQDATLKLFLNELDAKLDELEKETKYPARRAFYTIAGQVRNFGTHAAAIVLSEEPLDNIVPIVKVADNYVVGYTAGKALSIKISLPIVKLDILGLNTLEVLAMMYEWAGMTLDWENTDYEDQSVLEQYRQGNLVGIFQFESEGIQDFTVRLGPTRFADLYTINALYRPGPLRTGMADKYITYKKKGGRKIHDAIDSILEETLGIIVFQENLIMLYAEIADCTASEADLFRIDLTKQLSDSDFQRRLRLHRRRWIKGCENKGVAEAIAEHLWREMESFARYGFNIAHAVCYSAIGYQQMRIKVKHPDIFVAATLKLAFDNGKAQGVIIEADKLGVNVLPPRINSSGEFPIPKGDKVYLHLGAVKNVGANGVKAIIDERAKNGLFKSIADFRARIPARAVNKTAFLNLFRVGAFIGLPDFEEWLSKFGLFRNQIGDQKTAIELLGVMLDITMTKSVVESIKAKVKRTTKHVVNGGVVINVRPHKTRKGDPMGFIKFINISGEEWEIVVWPSLWGRVSEIVKLGDSIIAKGERDNPDEGNLDKKILLEAVGVYDRMGNVIESAKVTRYH